MKTKTDLKNIICGAFLGAAVVLTFGAVGSNPRTAWEYRVLYGQPAAGMEKVLNTAATEGWEFVDATTDSNNSTYSVVRRPKQ